MHALKNKVAIVTGASGGIGKATALLFAREGASLVLSGRKEDSLRKLADEISQLGSAALVCVGDLSDEATAKHLVEMAEEGFGGLDIAINHAGILGTLAPISELSLVDWNHTMSANLTSAFLASKYQIPALIRRGGGSIVFTSSFVGSTTSFPGMSAYASSKSALTGLTKTLALEYAADKIRVNALLPGGTETSMIKEFATSDEQIQALKSLYPLKRLAKPEEMAQATLFLASEASSFITGSSLLADGGISIN